MYCLPRELVFEIERGRFRRMFGLDRDKNGGLSCWEMFERFERERSIDAGIDSPCPVSFTRK